MKILLIVLLMFSLQAEVWADEDNGMTCTYFRESIEKDLGFCSAVRVGNTLYLSGKVGDGSMEEAVQKVYSALGAVLKKQNLTFKNVAKENVFTTNMDAFKKQVKLRKSFYDGWDPAATWVQVDRLYNPEFVLEVELIAVFPE